MTSGSLLFILCTVVCVVGALSTVFSRSPIRAAVGLLATILGIAGLFLNLSAEFLAAIQLIVYAGAVVVLFVFVIMLLGDDAAPQSVSHRSRNAKLVGGGLMALLALGVVIVLAPAPGAATRFTPVVADYGTVEAVGLLLFSKGIVPFEIATALLIVAVVGAIAVARGHQGERKVRPKPKEPRGFFAGALRVPAEAAPAAPPSTLDAEEGK